MKNFADIYDWSLLLAANIQNAMNFLAHLYLSNEIPSLVVGNFIADAVKGRAIEQYSTAIQIGIKMHRAIDLYTDTHALVRECVHLLRPTQGKFAPVVLDILFDHLLAKKWTSYHTTSLHQFSVDRYQQLKKYRDEFGLPQPMDFVLDMMIRDNWLFNYQFQHGIEHSLKGMQHRVKYPNNMAKGFDAILAQEKEFEHRFELFFDDLKSEITKVYF
jgi:acyl carrier protein phosphodiesterase